MELIRKPHKNYVNNHYITRNGVVPYYVDLILSGADPMGDEVKRVNDLIRSKWTISGLIYIKNKAWKEVVKFNESNKNNSDNFKNLDT